MNTKTLVGVLLAITLVAAGFYFWNRQPVVSTNTITATSSEIAAKKSDTEEETPTKIKLLPGPDGQSCYGTDGTSVYMDVAAGNRQWEKMSADPATFVTLAVLLNTCYAKDKHGLYVGTTLHTVSDPATLSITSYMRKNGYPSFFKDSLHVYHLIDTTLEIVPNADPTTFTPLPDIVGTDTSSVFAYDINQFYCYGNINTIIDVATARQLKNDTDSYIQDKNGTYKRGIDTQDQPNCVRE